MAFGPRTYRKFVRQVDRFLAVFLWLWLGGIAATCAVMFLPAERRELGLSIVSHLTIYPSMIGWFGLTGFEIVWSFWLRLRSFRGKRWRNAGRFAEPTPRVEWLATVFSLSLLATGMVFLWCAALLLWILMQHALTWSGLAISG